MNTMRTALEHSISHSVQFSKFGALGRGECSCYLMLLPRRRDAIFHTIFHLTSTKYLTVLHFIAIISRAQIRRTHPANLRSQVSVLRYGILALTKGHFFLAKCKS
eukprot:scaffold103_cov193-Alexandrium_tamarense.AAC.31